MKLWKLTVVTGLAALVAGSEADGCVSCADSDKTVTFSGIAGEGGLLVAVAERTEYTDFPITLSHGDQLEVRALPDAGYHFFAWNCSNPDYGTTGSEFVVPSLTEDLSCTVTFEADNPLESRRTDRGRMPQRQQRDRGWLCRVRA